MTARLGQLLVGLALLAALWVATDQMAGGGFGADPLPDPVQLPADLPTPPPDAVTAAVDSVHDGDTLTLLHPTLGRIRTRLLRIDTPEVARNGQPAECGADAARRSLVGLAPPDARVLVAHDVEPTDQYDRQLMHLWAADGTWINGQLVADGWARVVTFRPNEAHTAALVGLERAAQSAGRGVWGAC